MSRKPNYKFERIQRERNKAAKKEARRAAKEERSAQKNPEVDGASPETSDTADAEPGGMGEPEPDIQ